jgi:hypothetical protein
MYKFAGEVREAKTVYEKAAMTAMTARLDYLYNYDKEVNVEDKKKEYLNSRDQYRRLKQEYDTILSVPDVWGKTGLTLETLQKSTVRLPVDGKTSAFKVLHDMEERLSKARYCVPESGVLPPLHELLWIDM